MPIARKAQRGARRVENRKVEETVALAAEESYNILLIVLLQRPKAIIGYDVTTWQDVDAGSKMAASGEGSPANAALFAS